MWPVNSQQCMIPSIHHIGGGGYAACSGTALITTLSADQQIDSAHWTVSNSTRDPTPVLDPLGTSTAIKLTSVPTNYTLVQIVNAHFTSSSLTGGTTYTFHFYAKKISGSGWLWFLVDGGADFVQVPIDIGTGAFGTTSVGGTASLSCNQMQAVANGYYEISVGFIASTSTIAPVFKFFNADSGTDAQASSAHEIAYWNMGT